MGVRYRIGRNEAYSGSYSWRYADVHYPRAHPGTSLLRPNERASARRAHHRAGTIGRLCGWVASYPRVVPHTAKASIHDAMSTDPSRRFIAPPGWVKPAEPKR